MKGAMSRDRVYERDTDILFLHHLRETPGFVERLVSLAGVSISSVGCEIKGQVRHKADSGSIDIVARFKNGPIVLIENKIDASYSINRAGDGQPQRYQRSVAAFRSAGVEAFSILLAPSSYLSASSLANLFNARVPYEIFRDLLQGSDRELLEEAILQAEAPYEPVENVGAGEFFSAARALISEHFPDLVMKPEPNNAGIRPSDARTIYFDVPRTLRTHVGVPRPRMSLQCLDKAAPSASVKIMLKGRAALAKTLKVTPSLTDIGGYLRPAGRSLGITIDTPRLETQRTLAEQADDIAEALQSALRLQRWWNENGDVLRAWSN